MKIAEALALSLLLFPVASLAAGLEVGGTTILRFEQRGAPGVSKATLVPALQYLGLDADRLGNGNLSAHLFGWGRVDLADESGAEGKSEGDLSHAFLSYRFARANGEIKAGRFTLTEPGSFEYLDGVSARADLAVKGVSTLLFAGAPVKGAGESSNRGDYLTGAQLSYRHPTRVFELAASLVREGGMQIDPAAAQEDYRQDVAADLLLAPFRGAELTGRTSYNTATGGLSEGSCRLGYRRERLSVAALYQSYDLKHYYAASSIPSLFNPNNGASYAVYGAEATWRVSPLLEANLDYRHYDRDLTGTSDRGGGMLRLNLAERGILSGLSYHRSASRRDGLNSYHELRGYCLYDKARLSASLDLIAQLYDNEIDSEKGAYQGVASLGYRFYPEVALSADLSLAANPRYDNEVKGLLRLVWNYQTVIGAAK